MWILLDDARADSGAEALFFAEPSELVVARTVDEVRPALQRLRTALRAGHHVAGYLAYEAGFALDPALVGQAPTGEGPLLLFGLFDAPRRLDRVGRAVLLEGAGSAACGAPQPRIEEAAYRAAAERVDAALHAGDYYQANLTFPNDVAVHGEPLALYALLARHGGGGWGGVLVHEERALVSLSPESFFTLQDGTLTARPMKGTAPRVADPAADVAAAKALREDEKQRAENLMIVDLLRNDLARVSETGSVAVPDLFAIETYPTVHQMVSRVTSKVREGLDAIDVIEALFPCGSVTGAPKIAAMQALVALEAGPRGAYTGSMGWIAPHGADGTAGEAAFNVMIRTLEIADRAARRATLGLGSGLVVDSQAVHEWAECRLKGQFVTAARPDFDLIETFRYEPVEGLVDLERHLERMKGAAADLGFTFDRHDARNELQAASFGYPDSAMARLLASPTGAMAIELRPLPDMPPEPVAVTIVPHPVGADDFRLRYKTSDRAFYDRPRRDAGTFEVLFERDDGALTEGSFTNLFVERDGILLTPPLDLGLIPGVLRQRLVEEGRAREELLTRADLIDGFMIGNSVRGLIRARLA